MVVSLLHLFLPSDGVGWLLQVVLTDRTEQGWCRYGKLAGSVMHETQGSRCRIKRYWELIQLDVDSLTVLQTTLFNLLCLTAYNYNVLIDLQTRSRSVQGSHPCPPEYGERVRSVAMACTSHAGNSRKFEFSTVRAYTCHSISPREV
jgi:hypothetical protein